jgi:hypothetical protein
MEEMFPQHVTEAVVSISHEFEQAKVKFDFEGKTYAMRMSLKDFADLKKIEHENIKVIGVVSE